MNALRRTFTELKRFSLHWYVVYLEEVQRQDNVNNRIPLLNYQNAGEYIKQIN
jgi:hypothetical protein